MINCTHCGWPFAEHHINTDHCPDYTTPAGWLNTTFESR